MVMERLGNLNNTITVRLANGLTLVRYIHTDTAMNLAREIVCVVESHWLPLVLTEQMERVTMQIGLQDDIT